MAPTRVGSGAFTLPIAIHLLIVARLIPTCRAASEVVNFPLIMSSVSHLFELSSTKSHWKCGQRKLCMRRQEEYLNFSWNSVPCACAGVLEAVGPDLESASAERLCELRMTGEPAQEVT